MQTVSLRSRADENGLLHLEVPVGIEGAEVDVVVVMQLLPSPLVPLEQLAGAIDDETFVELVELPFEEREAIP